MEVLLEIIKHFNLFIQKHLRLECLTNGSGDQLSLRFGNYHPRALHFIHQI